MPEDRWDHSQDVGGMAGEKGLWVVSRRDWGTMQS